MFNFIMEKDDHGSNLCSTTSLSGASTTTSTSPPSTPSTDEGIETGTHLYRPRLIVENHLYDQLINQYRVATTRLEELASEANALHEENEWLRLSNEDLTRRLSSFSLSNDTNNNMGRVDNGGGSGWNSPRSVIQGDQGDQGRVVCLSKSISVRSPSYFKLVNSSSPASPVVATPPLLNPSPIIPSSRHVNATKLRVRKEEKAVEMEVFNQGMYKTELCNKWQETGTCPYSDNCQFAHGISELRPVIRHPRYKTQVCRMVLTGATCPYGYRCHFRHSTTTRLSS